MKSIIWLAPAKMGIFRFTIDRGSYAAMRKYAGRWPGRVWAVEGSNGAGRPLSQSRPLRYLCQLSKPPVG
jgi:hypothetical protein